MLHMNYRVVLCAALGVFTLSHPPAFAQAGFDCAKASTMTEKAICASPDVAEADRAMSIAYKELIKRVDPVLKEALQVDQAEFIKLRAEAFESHLANEAMRQESLLYRTETRAEFLNWIAVTDSVSLEGTWRNVWGLIKVEKKASGKLAVNVDVADQANGSWVCSFEGELEQKSATEAEFKGEGGPLILQLKGATLNIPTPFCDASTSGGFGTAAGSYFRVGE